jgi:hypothetical protein
VQYNEQLDGEMIQVDSANTQTNPQELPEQNRKIMNEFYMGYLNSGKTIIQDHYSSILSIAMQCPYAGGPAVYQARAFISLINDEVEYNDVAVCLQNGLYRTTETKSQASPSLALLPNPANDRVTVKLMNSESAIVDIEFLDALGQVVFGKKVHQNLEINTATFIPGLYMVKVSLSDGTTLMNKLVINR